MVIKDSDIYPDTNKLNEKLWRKKKKDWQTSIHIDKVESPKIIDGLERLRVLEVQIQNKYLTGQGVPWRDHESVTDVTP